MPRAIHPCVRLGLALAFLMVPSVCLANGWISGVNAFRQTPEFYVLFAAIVVLESAVLWVWVRPINCLQVLWRVLLLNAVSSLAGDALFRLGWAPSSSSLWKQAVPFFLLTLALECPLLRALYRKCLHTWKRTLLISVSANVASYALLLAIDRPVRNAWLNDLRAKDRKILAQWTNTQMLAQATGRIYATESGPGPSHHLKYFDFGEQRWYSVTNSSSLSMDPRYWHVEGDLFAFLTYGDPSSRGLVKLTTLPGCETIRVFRLPPTTYRYDSGWDVAISPDRSKLAVLVPLHEIQKPLSGSSYQVLGKTCLLVVFDIATGEMTTCPRKASHTLCWLPDSQSILFHSLLDQDLHELTTLPKAWKRNYGVRKPDNPFLHPFLFAYRLGPGTVEQYANAPSPCLAAEAKRLAFRNGKDAIGLIDLDSNVRSTVRVGSISSYRELTFSPDGRFALVPLVLNKHVSSFGHSAIVDLNDPSRRYYIGPTIYRVLWARTAM